MFYKKLFLAITKIYWWMEDFGFYIILWEFWAWKTQAATLSLKESRHNRINISNYYTGYSDIQIQSYKDLINFLNDVNDYHQYISIIENYEERYKFKKNLKDDYIKSAKEFMNKYQLNYNYIKKHIKINLVLDECWIYFNSRNFDKNFKGENAKILDYIYQPRKINILLQLIVQNPSEIDVKFRRLAMWYRKYYRGFFFIRWFKDYYFPNPDNIDFEKAAKIRDAIGNIRKIQKLK